MTVEAVSPFVSDFGDLSKQLGLLGDLDFSSEELDQMSTDFLSAPGLVPSLDPEFCFAPPLLAQPMETGSADGGSSGASGFIKLESLHAGSPHSVLPLQAAASPASSGSQQTSNWSPSGEGTPSGEGASSDDYLPCAETAPTKKDPRIGRRKPEVDLSSITDLAERRKQRRLAKNRATAATSRERKRRQLSELSVQVTKLEQQNSTLAQMLAQRDSEIIALKSALDASAPAGVPH